MKNCCSRSLLFCCCKLWKAPACLLTNRKDVEKNLIAIFGQMVGAKTPHSTSTRKKRGGCGLPVPAVPR